MSANYSNLTSAQQKMLEDIAKKTGCLEAIYQTGMLPTVVDKDLEKFITNDKDLIEQKIKIKKYAPLSYPVLITGNTGTGKELFAKALHGDRKGKFIAVNITALPSELVESELFGHIKGSFTGADKDRLGLFQEAENGTLFLDEIGYMPLYAQAKLLRVLEEKQIRMVGSNTYIPINCRIVCATRMNLEELIKNEKFLEDLFWRIQYLKLKTKSLRARPGDIHELLDAIFDPKGLIPQDVRDTWEKNEAFFGNVRELEAKAVEYIANL